MNELTVRSTCRVCGAADLDLIIDYGLMPLAGGFIAAEEQQRPYPLRLFRCSCCTLMQVVDVVAPDLVFRNYSYASSTTRTLREHFARLAPVIVERAGAAGRLAVEFGCNDGVLMRPLRDAGAQALGVDPSDVALRASLAQDWPLIPQYFTEEVGRQIAGKYGRAQLVVGANVLAHADDLHSIVRGVESLMSDEGHFVFEVHYQGDLISLVQYDTVYHEHLCYYSLRSIEALLRPHGLRIAGVERIPIHSGSVRVTAVREGSSYAESADVSRMLDAEWEWDVGQFIRLVEIRRVALRRLVLGLKTEGRHIAAYGAAGRVTILLNYCGLDGGVIDYVVDASPLRQGRYVPGVSVPIVPPERFRETPPDYAIMTAWNYEEEIIAREQSFLSGGGQFIIPLPEVRLEGRA